LFSFCNCARKKHKAFSVLPSRVDRNFVKIFAENALSDSTLRGGHESDFPRKINAHSAFFEDKVYTNHFRNLRLNGQVLDIARGRQKSPYKLNIRLNTLHFLGNFDRSSFCRVHA
jgi:hypothetical protein